MYFVGLTKTITPEKCHTYLYAIQFCHFITNNKNSQAHKVIVLHITKPSDEKIKSLSHDITQPNPSTCFNSL